MRNAAFSLSVFTCLFAFACGRAETTPGPAASAPAPAAARPAGPPSIAVLTVRGMGEIRIELAREKAPKTVESFETLAESGFFDGTTFHRVIPGFMIQGGDPNTKNRDPRDDGRGGPGYQLAYEANDLSHLRGTVSMANPGNKNRAGSQFFICVGDKPELDGSYTAFGRVVAGMDVGRPDRRGGARPVRPPRPARPSDPGRGGGDGRDREARSGHCVVAAPALRPLLS
jgi:cyclophilin family peptidyl-prolyl cis-trans isomerase